MEREQYAFGSRATPLPPPPPSPPPLIPQIRPDVFLSEWNY